MAYVGTPLDTTNAFQSLAGKRFSGDASTTDFTLDSAPNSTLDIEVFVENVRQDPNSAYTVSGTTLGFTAAPPSGTNNIYVVHQAKAVGTIGIPDDTVNSQTDIGANIADADLFLIDDGAGGTLRKTAASRIKTYAGFEPDAAQVFNESGADVDFRFESDTKTHMLTVDGGNDVVGISGGGFMGDLGVGLHIKTADTSASVNNDGDELVIENGGSGLSAGMTILSATNGYGSVCFGDSGDDNIGIVRYDHNTNSLDFFTNATEAMTIDSSGRLCIGHSSGAHTFHLLKDVGGDAVAAIENSNDTNPQGLDIQFTAANPDNNSQYAIHFGAASVGTKFVVYSDGDVQNHDNSYGGTSDQRIKDNIADATSQWDDIKALKVRKFKLKDDIREYGADKAKYKIGLVAQEAEAVSPNLINECSPGINDIKSDSTFGTLYKDGDVIPDGKAIGEIKEEKATVKGIKYSILYMKAIKALQEAQTRIETLETKVKALEEA